MSNKLLIVISVQAPDELLIKVSEMYSDWMWSTRRQLFSFPETYTRKTWVSKNQVIFIFDRLSTRLIQTIASAKNDKIEIIVKIIMLTFSIFKTTPSVWEMLFRVQ